MRRAEIGSLNRQDVQDGWAHEALVIGKGDKERDVFFGEDSQQAIRAYLEARSDNLVPLFLRHDNRRGVPGPGGEHWRLSLQSVWGIVKDYARAVGVPATTHHFRHLKASTPQPRGQPVRSPGHPGSRLARNHQAHLRALHAEVPAGCRREVQRHAGRAGRRARGRAGTPARPFYNVKRHDGRACGHIVCEARSFARHLQLQ
jgi:Phage integrase family